MERLKNLTCDSDINSVADQKRLERNLAELMADGVVVEIPVVRRKHPMVPERWFRDLETGEVYRYREPDFPASGTWEPVDKADQV